MDINFRRCTLDDVEVLVPFARNCFFETFDGTTSDKDLETYMNSSFRVDKFSEELENPNSFFYFLYCDGDLAGFLKLNTAPAQTEINDDAALEIERIYISSSFHRKGLGNFLVNKAVEFAKDAGKTYIFLGVWEHNYKAQDFYKSNGFFHFSSHTFWMGDDEQTDFIYKKDLI